MGNNKLKVANIISALEESSLDYRATHKAINAIKEKSDGIQEFLDTGNKNQEDNFEKVTTTLLMRLTIGPIFVKYGVPAQKGQEVYMNIYESLGGYKTSHKLTANVN